MASFYVNTSIADVEKLKYLISMLSREAKDSVSGSFLFNENYQVAEELLKERYEDKQAVETSHYREMINLKQAPNSPNDLCNLYNQIENI